MAKSRFSLDETMADAVKGIKEAQNATAESAVKENIPEPSATEPVATEPSADSQPKAETEQSQAGTVEVAGEETVRKTQPAAEEEVSIGKSFSGKNISRHKKKVNQTAVEKEARNIRNVYLSDETLECLEMIKKELNSSRKSKEEPFVSAANIMNLAIEEFIDRNFPDVRKLCRMIAQMKMKP